MTDTATQATPAPLKFTGRWKPSHKRRIETANQNGTYEDGPNSDREWFKAHPGREYRLRFAVPGEEPFWKSAKLSMNALMIVRQIIPGARVRVPIKLFALPIDFSEAEAKKLWQTVQRIYPAIGAKIQACTATLKDYGK